MSPKLLETKVTSIQPTADELAVAKKHVASLNPQQLKSKRVSLLHFLKHQPDGGKDCYEDGKLKPDALDLFHVHVMRCTATQKTQVSSKEKIRKTSLKNKLDWFAWEQMDRELGAKKGVIWRKCGILPTRPCPVTKSRDEDVVQYGCPRDWEEYSDDMLKKLKQDVEMELQEDDDMDITRRDDP
jgi:hypothetical protein